MICHMVIDRLGLAEIGKHGVDQLKGLIDLLANLGTSQDNLSTDEDEQDDLGLHHTIDETREKFRPEDGVSEYYTQREEVNTYS